MASLLFLTSFYLFSIMYCSTSYCVPIESSKGFDIFDKLEPSAENSVFRIPAPIFSNLLDFCAHFRQRRSLKVACLFCTGFNLSCFLPVSTTTSPTTTSAATTTTTAATSTTSASTTTTTASTTTSTTTTSTAAPAEDA